MRLVDLQNIMGETVVAGAGFVDDATYDDPKIVIDADAIPGHPVRIVVRPDPPMPQEIYRAATEWNIASLQNAGMCTPENSRRSSDAEDRFKRLIGYVEHD